METHTPTPKNDVYQHENENIYEAIGMSDEHCESVVDKMNQIISDSSKRSEVVEKFATNFSRKELAYILLNNNDGQCRQAEPDEFAEFMRKMLESR